MAAPLLSFVSRLALCVALAVMTAPLPAQPLAFKPVPLPESTTLGHISAITQDRHGFMWLATHTGLHRYDGYRWNSYWNQSPTPGYLIGNRSESVYADPEGFIWVGTYASGLHRFDPATGVFTKIKLDARDSSGRHSTFVTALTPDRHGNLWVGTHEGLYRMNRKTRRVTHYRHDPRDPSSLSNDRVWVIYEDRQGTIWVGTGTPWERPREAGGLNRLDPRTGTFTRYLHDPNDPASLAANPVRAILEDSRGTFWVGTFGDGLHTMDRRTGKFRRYPSDSTRPSALSRPFPADGNFTKDGVSFVHEDHAGALWIGAYNSGLVRYEPATGKVTRYNPDPDNPEALREKGPWAVCTSREGILWVGTFGGGGLYRVDPLQKTIPHYQTGAQVNAFFQEPSGVHWLGTTHGLLRRDPGTGHVRRYAHDPRDPGSLTNDTVNALCEDRQGTLWVATRGGLHCLDRQTGKMTRYRHDPNQPGSLAHNLIYSLHQDRQGGIWMSLPEGLDRLDPRTRRFTHYRLLPAGSVKSVIDRPMLEDGQGNLWVTGYGGICRLDPVTGRVQRYMADGNFPSIHKDHRGEFWLGAIQGIFRQGRTSGDFARFRDPTTGTWIPPVVSIAEDLDLALWLSTGLGLICLDKDRKTIRTYGSEYGVNGRSIVTKKAYRGPAGELFFGTGTGYYVVVPRELGRDRQPPQVVLTDFRLGDHPVKPGPGSPLAVPLSETAAITLLHHQNTFAFDFAGMHYGNPGQNPHLFRLEGYDRDWRRAGSEKSASYYNVLPGKYTFRVRAASSDKAWAERTIAVTVRPPWWKTSWAYLGYAVLAAGLTGFAYRNVIRRERLQADLKIRQVEADKLRELDQAKSRFFSNISHELRTPLTLIRGSAAILREGEKKESPARKGHYDLLERNTGRLLQLISQLLDLSRLEAGKLELQPKAGNLTHFLRAVIHAFGSLAERQQVEYRVSIPDGSRWAYFDADKLEKILNNLLSNACKFTPSGGTIAVEVLLEVLPGGSVYRCVLRVSDTGIGISEAQLARVFDRFYQADDSGTRAYEGSGVGLTLAKELTELYGGQIAVESILGQGSRFEVTIPLPVAEPVPDEVPAPPVTTHFNALPEGNLPAAPPPTGEAEEYQTKILIIEDNADLRTFIRMALPKEYYVLEAEDGEKGWELAVEALPDLIISDVMMPKQDGLTLCQRLKKHFSTAHIPVVLLTARAAMQDKITGLLTGADDYIVKPFHHQELQARVRNLVEDRKRLRELFRREILLQPDLVSPPSADEVFLRKVVGTVEQYLSDQDFDVERLGEEVCLSRTQLYRKLFALTGQAPSDFIRTLRLKRGAALLGQKTGTVAEIAYQIGFKEPSYFSRCFAQVYGCPPSQYTSAPAELSS